MSRILAFSKANPILFGVGFSTVKTSVADLLVQNQFEGKGWKEIDWRRNLSFAVFGCVYLGGLQYMIYVPIFGRLFPRAEQFAALPFREKIKDVKGIASMLGQVFLDQCVHHPLMYFPVFYSLKECINGGTIMEGLQKYQKNWKEDLVALWKVWVPATIFNFTFSPMYLRIPVVASTSLFWTCILSAMRGRHEDSATVTSSEAMESVANQSKLIAKWMHPTAPPLKPDLDHFILIASGKDRIGFVSAVTDAIANGQGSVSESKMVKMGGHFMLMMLVSVDPTLKPQLVGTLTDRTSKLGDLLDDIHLSDISESNRRSHELGGGLASPAHPEGHASLANFKLDGPDRPGIVAQVATSLASHGLNIERMETTVVTDPSTGQHIFRISGQASAETEKAEFQSAAAEISKLGLNFAFEFGK